MDNLPPYLIVIVVIICLLASATFCACENAFSNCDIYHYKVLANEGNRRAKHIYRLATKYDDSLVTILVGNNLFQVIMSNVSAIFFLQLADVYQWANGVESIISTIFMTLLLYLFADLLPKIISKNFPNRTAEIVIYPAFIFYILFFPIIIIFRGLLLLIKKISHVKGDLSITKEEFIDKAIEADDEVLEEDEKTILKSAFKFDNIQVKQVLTPKNKIFSINIEDLTAKKLNNVLLSVNYSRIPVYEDNKDNIIGILTIRSYFKEYIEDKHLDIRSVLIEPLKVRDNEKVDDIFAKFNNEKTHIALVYDDKEQLIGMITMEDVLEELVGDINENLDSKSFKESLKNE